MIFVIITSAKKPRPPPLTNSSRSTSQNGANSDQRRRTTSRNWRRNKPSERYTTLSLMFIMFYIHWFPLIKFRLRRKSLHNMFHFKIRCIFKWKKNTWRKSPKQNNTGKSWVCFNSLTIYFYNILTFIPFCSF